MSLWTALTESLRLLASGDAEVLRIVLLSLAVSGAALVISSAFAIPFGLWLAFRRFWWKRTIMAFLYTGVGLPPVLVGLVVYLMLSRSGPLGWLGWLYTPESMVLAQIVISFPIIASLTMAAVMSVDSSLRSQVLSLGASDVQAGLAVLKEAKVGVVIALVAGFGSVISEVGAVMMVGGNLKGSTQVLTTAIVQFTRMGQFEHALALGLVLLSITFMVALMWLTLQGRRLED